MSLSNSVCMCVILSVFVFCLLPVFGEIKYNSLNLVNWSCLNNRKLVGIYTLVCLGV